MRKDDRNVHVFQNRYWGPFTEEKRGYSFWKNGSFVYVELKELVEAATSSYSATDDLLRYIYSVLVAKNHQNTQSRCLVHEFSFTDIFLNSILYGCGFLLPLWKGAQNNVHCNYIVPPWVVLFFFQLQSWIILGMKTKFKNFMRREWLWR